VDGAPLHEQTTERNVHALQTFLLPNARQWDDKPTVAIDGATRVDVVVAANKERDTNLHVVDVSDSDLPLFDPTVSDEQTAALAARVWVEPAAPSKPGSSDPPTRFVRRYADHIDLPPGSVVDETYEIDAKLGAGAMGEVYAAKHTKLGKRVAIKVISPKLSEDAGAVERFAQEARTLAAIHHPNIVDVLGFGELADGRAYFVMEHLAGDLLRDRLDRGRPPLDEALDIIDQVARALEAAHAHGAVHRDVKPENIFIERIATEPRGIIRLLDFGLAKLVADVDRRTERTQSGVAIGTPMYFSPEQARGHDVDHRTDIYALGCVAYELVLGRVPFIDAKTVPSLFAAHLHEAPPMPRTIWTEIPPQLDLVLFAMLAKNPAHRPTLTQIRSVLASVRSTSMSRPQPQHAPAAQSSRPRAIAAIAGVAIGAAVVGGIRVRFSGRVTGTPQTSAIAEPTDAGSERIAVAPRLTIDAGISDRSTTRDSHTEAPAQPRRSPVDAGIASVTRLAPVDAGAVRVDADASANVARAAAAPTPPEYGALALSSTPPCDVLIDGFALGRTPVASHSLVAGRHDVTFDCAALGAKTTYTVEIKPGEVSRIAKDFTAELPPVDPNGTIDPFHGHKDASR
jgi:serine/threonine protein kinase